MDAKELKAGWITEDTPMQEVAWTPPVPNETVGMNFQMGVSATEHDAIMKFRRECRNQGVDWIEGTERAHMHFEEPVTKKVKGYAATDVRGGIFSLYVHRYEEVERTEIMGYTWSVIAEREAGGNVS